MFKFLVRVFGPRPDGTPALLSSEIVSSEIVSDAGDTLRYEVAVGTVVREDGEMETVWAECDLTYGPLRTLDGRWTCGPDEFARRFRAREARYLDGGTGHGPERIVMAGVPS